MPNSQFARTNMVKQQLRCSNILQEDVLDLFDIFPRNEFVPQQYVDFAYSDMQIPLAHGQRMLTPVEEGLIIQALDLKGHETVLEIGTGTGFLTALLSHQAAKVISIDYFASFTEMAKANLAKHNCKNVELITADASSGWLDKAPFDIIVFTGAVELLTEMMRLQVLPGGKLFAIVGNEPVMQGQLHQLSHDNTWQAKILFETSIPPLIDKLKPKEFVF